MKVITKGITRSFKVWKVVFVKTGLVIKLKEICYIFLAFHLECLMRSVTDSSIDFWTDDKIHAYGDQGQNGRGNGDKDDDTIKEAVEPSGLYEWVQQWD